MPNNCIYKRIRTHKGIKYTYCLKHKQEDDLKAKMCYNCNDREFKKVKPINQVSKKRIFVSKETYNKVMSRCASKCALCGNTNALQYHHILYRSERKDLIDEPLNGIVLCLECHKKVHNNKKKWQPILMEMVKDE